MGNFLSNLVPGRTKQSSDFGHSPYIKAQNDHGESQVRTAGSTTEAQRQRRKRIIIFTLIGIIIIALLITLPVTISVSTHRSRQPIHPSVQHAAAAASSSPTVNSPQNYNGPSTAAAVPSSSPTSYPVDSPQNYNGPSTAAAVPSSSSNNYPIDSPSEYEPLPPVAEPPVIPLPDPVPNSSDNPTEQAANIGIQ